jgi:hypothetical protein
MKHFGNPGKRKGLAGYRTPTRFIHQKPIDVAYLKGKNEKNRAPKNT